MKKINLTRNISKEASERIQRGEVTLRQAARELRLHHSTLKKKLEEFNFPWQPEGINSKRCSWRARVTIPQVKAGVKLLHKGETYTKVCQDLGIKICELRRLSKRLGICVNKQRPDSPFVVPLTETDKSYMAGFIDGEGSLMAPRKNHTAWSIVVYNTNEDVMKWFGKHGGFTYKRPPHGFGKKMQYGWHLNAKQDVTLCLTTIIPYLRVKRKKALEALAFIFGKSISIIETEYPSR